MFLSNKVILILRLCELTRFRTLLFLYSERDDTNWNVVTPVVSVFQSCLYTLTGKLLLFGLFCHYTVGFLWFIILTTWQMSFTYTSKKLIYVSIWELGRELFMLCIFRSKPQQLVLAVLVSPSLINGYVRTPYLLPLEIASPWILIAIWTCLLHWFITVYTTRQESRSRQLDRDMFLTNSWGLFTWIYISDWSTLTILASWAHIALEEHITVFLGSHTILAVFRFKLTISLRRLAVLIWQICSTLRLIQTCWGYFEAAFHDPNFRQVYFTSAYSKIGCTHCFAFPFHRTLWSITPHRGVVHLQAAGAELTLAVSVW